MGRFWIGPTRKIAGDFSVSHPPVPREVPSGRWPGRGGHNPGMTLTELRYIVAVARERHFGRAAEACFVSQPTLSVAIKKLEEELDVKIFERGSSEVTMTPLGEAIVRQAQQVIEQAQAIREIAKRGKDPLAGPLRLGLIYTCLLYTSPSPRDCS